MKYCMLENTANDLRDAVEKMGNTSYSDLSETEQEGYDTIVKLAYEIVKLNEERNG